MKNKHDSALIPLEVWPYNSPLLSLQNKRIDLGLLAEGLIYYDKLYIDITTTEQLEELVFWFISQGKYTYFLRLLEEKTIQFFYYSFMSTAINNQGEFSIWNIQSPPVEGIADFMRLIVYKAHLDRYLHARQRAKLYKLIEQNLIEETSGDYEKAIEDARRVFNQPDKYSVLVQSFVNNIYRHYHLQAPVIDTKIDTPEKGKFIIHTNYDYDLIRKMTNEKIIFRREMPLIGEATSNRLISTSIKYGYDLLLGEVQSAVVGSKLIESLASLQKTSSTVNSLKEEVEFPDIHKEVNDGNLDLDFIIKIRSNSQPFRTWLQQESDRDRNAIIAYHREVSKASGLTKAISTGFKLFGFLGQLAPLLTLAIRPEIVQGVPNEVVFAGYEVGGIFLSKVADSFSKEWRPVIFGDYFTSQYKKEKS